MRARERLLRRLTQRKARGREGLFVVEGIHTAAEALDARLSIEFAVCAPTLRDTERGQALIAGLETGGIDVEWVPDPDLAALADTETPQGVLLVCAQPTWSLADIELTPTSTVLICDGVQDPGNLGTLARSAAAFGLSGVILLEGSVDPWSPKSVRASAGASFRVAIVAEPWAVVREWIREHDVDILVADAAGEDVIGVERRRALALVVGNEGSGTRAEIVRAASRLVAVPIQPSVDSLNVAVAGSILLYELTRKSARA
ncbi:MAG: RNA methyltransferase [Gemmatimonadetes bacterium]|nr:RNA methyltransferase [Gemmatimonadota bacterium]